MGRVLADSAHESCTRDHAFADRPFMGHALTVHVFAIMNRLCHKYITNMIMTITCVIKVKIFVVVYIYTYIYTYICIYTHTYIYI